MREIAKNIVLKTPILKKRYLRYQEKKGEIIKIKDLNLDEANVVLLEKPLNKQIVVGLVKDGYYIQDDYIEKRAYYPKYERFLKNNNIQYEYFNINSSDWQENAKRFDVIIWRSLSYPANQYIAKNKIYILEKFLGKVCLPSYGDIWSYEDKINIHFLFKLYNFPEIPTFISNSKEEALGYVQKAKYPFVSKITTGSGSLGVEIIKSKKQADRIVQQVFSKGGKKTYWPYQGQKDYVYFQEFIDSATYDLRVMVVGDKLLGYYRYPKKGDFRASGSGIEEKKEIPTEALELAYNVKNTFGSTFIATDMLYNIVEKRFLIIETSIFIAIDTCKQLIINGTPGYYQRIAENEYVFKEGKFWVQELAVKELLEKSFQ